MIGVQVYRIEIERADGEIRYLNDGKEYERDFAEEMVEYVWNMKAHTGNYASFRVVDEDGEVLTEFEC